ncbi:MAG: glycosyltransferase [Thermoleophilaceae bacterium]
MRILLVSQMYPGPADPDLGAFVAQVERELVAQGHLVERAVIDRRGGRPTKYARLLFDALRVGPLVPSRRRLRSLPRAGRRRRRRGGRRPSRAGRADGPRARRAQRRRDPRRRPDHPTGHRARGVRDRQLGVPAGRAARPGAGTRRPDRGDRLRRRPRALPRRGRRRGPRSRGLGRPRSALCVRGGLDERKNVARLVEAFQALGRGSLVLVGDGPARASLEGVPGTTLVGRIPHDQVADWITACDVLCLPSTVEPLGQVVLEAMASERSVVATRVGGPPELVPPEAGVLVDPGSTEDITAGMASAAALPSPNPAARRAAAEHDVRRQAGRMAEVLERVIASPAISRR